MFKNVNFSLFPLCLLVPLSQHPSQTPSMLLQPLSPVSVLLIIREMTTNQQVCLILILCLKISFLEGVYPSFVRVYVVRYTYIDVVDFIMKCPYS